MGKPKGIKQVDIVKHWNCSAAYVSQCVKAGMPLTSLDEADKWRAKSQPTGTGYRTKGPAKPAKSTAAMVQPAKNSPAELSSIVTTATLSSALGDDTEDALLARVRSTERGIFNLLNSAIAAGDFKVIAVYQRDHSTAVRALAEAEKVILELRKERGELVERIFAKTVIHDALAPVMAALDNLPRNYGLKVRPDNPVEGERILQEAVDEIRRSAESSLRNHAQNQPKPR